MSAYTQYFLGSKSNVVQLETLEISHTNFSKVYRIVRNSVAGITATLEAGNGTHTFDYYPLKITTSGETDDLDVSLQIDVGDLGEVWPQELDNVTQANGFGEKPAVVYRTFRSDDLSKPLFGPINLELTSFSFTKSGASIVARAPQLNVVTTGESYKTDRFPMLRGLL